MARKMEERYNIEQLKISGETVVSWKERLPEICCWLH